MSYGKKFPVWVYWAGGPAERMPVYLTIVHETIQAQCQGCSVTLVTRENLSQYLPDIEICSSEIDSDLLAKPSITETPQYVALALLSRYGGLWLDIDCILLQNVGSVAEDILLHYDFYGMQKSPKNSVLVPWMMASRPGGKVVSDALKVLGDAIGEKLKRDEQYSPGELAIQSLTSVVTRNSELCYLEPRTLLCPMSSANVDCLWQNSDLFRLEEYVPGGGSFLKLHMDQISDARKQTPRRQLLNSNTLLGQALRRAGNSPVIDLTVVKAEPGFSDVELIFTTIERPKCALAFVKSIRRVLGDEIAIHFIVQGQDSVEYQQAEADYGCQVTRVDFDYGLGASRNLLVEASTRPFLFLTDDDFLFDERLALQQTLDLMRIREDIGVLGGLYENYNYDAQGLVIGQPKIATFNHFSLREGETLNYFPAEYVELPREFIDEFHYIKRVDSVNNLALFRRDLFDDYGLRWDPLCKITGEHVRFYEDYKHLVGENLKIYYSNMLITQHHRHANEQFTDLRQRTTGLQSAMKGLQLKQLHFYGKRREILQQDGSTHSIDSMYWKIP